MRASDAGQHQGLHHVHFVRHGRVASHRGDVPVTPEGLEEAHRFGRRLADRIAPGEIVAFLHAPTLRTRQTAVAIREGLAEALGMGASVRDGARPEPHEPGDRPGGGPQETRASGSKPGGMGCAATAPHVVLGQLEESWALRNPDLYVGGMRVEMVSTPEALAAQTGRVGVGVECLTTHPFFRSFWDAPERIGYWLAHPDPPGEDADAVARRLRWFAASLHDLPFRPVRRFVCVTHSAPMRAFLSRYVLDHDPGEPEFVEEIAVTVGRDGGLSVTFRERSVWIPAVGDGRRFR